MWSSTLKKWTLELSWPQQAIGLFLMGAVGALAMPPVYWWPVLLVIFPIFWHVLNHALTTRHVFWATWVFGLGYYTAGLYWIAAALFVDIANNWWVLPFAVLGLPSLMAFYPAVFMALWHRMAWQGTARVLLMIVGLSIAEIIRGSFFTGFPWNLWGYTWVDTPAVAQIVSVIGIYGLTVVTLLMAFMPVMVVMSRHSISARAVIGVFLLLGIYGIAWGQGRLAHPHDTPNLQAMQIRIVQPNIAQQAKSDSQQRLLNAQKLWDLTAMPSPHPLHMIVWPETALTLVSTDDVRQFEATLSSTLAPDAVLAAGVLDVGWNQKTDQPEFYNRIAFFNGHPQRLGVYDKSHLVPFGEYLPFQEWWPVRPVAFKQGRFTAGAGAETISFAGFPSFSPLICYEVLFPTQIVDDDVRPNWLLNVTNDAWYGRTSGPYQHLAITQMRAIEQGLPLIRAANTGVSAVIDSYGRIVESLPLGQTGVIDASLPAFLQPTLFSRFPKVIPAMLAGMVWLIAYGIQRSNRKAIPSI